jgi:hypothetical protein
MHIGMLVYGVICQLLLIVILGLVMDKPLGYISLSLWSGLALAFIGLGHMNRTLERALSSGGKAAGAMFGGYILRYVVLGLAAAVAARTGALNVIILFLGYMSMKAAALSQPFTHKLCNAYFHETDPIPEAIPEQPSTDADIVADTHELEDTIGVKDDSGSNVIHRA